MTEFISRKYGNKDYEVIIKTDSKEHYKAAEDFARRLIDHTKPKTNADRIRAMSDEELARWMCGGSVSTESACKYCDKNNGEFCNGEKCRGKTDTEIIMEWLKQPAEVEHE